jgi:hypothetical protein
MENNVPTQIFILSRISTSPTLPVVRPQTMHSVSTHCVEEHMFRSHTHPCTRGSTTPHAGSHSRLLLDNASTQPDPIDDCRARHVIDSADDELEFDPSLTRSNFALKLIDLLDLHAVRTSRLIICTHRSQRWFAPNRISCLAISAISLRRLNSRPGQSQPLNARSRTTICTRYRTIVSSAIDNASLTGRQPEPVAALSPSQDNPAYSPSITQRLSTLSASLLTSSLRRGLMWRSSSERTFIKQSKCNMTIIILL